MSTAHKNDCNRFVHRRTAVALAAEDEAYYHESALNATWTGSRLAIGGLTFGFGCFQLAVLVWLEMLLARSRYIPALSFVEQAPHVH